METKPIQVLLVEDDLPAAQLLCHTVEAARGTLFNFTHVTRLTDALLRLATAHFDIVLLDLSLPDSQGRKTVTQVHAAAPTVPIVVLTGSDDEELALAAVREGAQDYLVKGTFDRRMLARVMRYTIERHRAEEVLREREEFFRLISENMTDLVAVIGLDGKRVYNSPSYKGLLPDPMLQQGKNSFMEIHPDDQARIRSVFQETVATGIGQRSEYRFVVQDGTIRHVESQGNVIKDKAGKASKVVVISRDISERKHAEQSLRESEKRYRGIIESTTDYICSTVVRQRQVVATTHGPGCVAVTGYTPQEFEADPYLWYQMVQEQDRAAVVAHTARVLAGEALPPLEHRIHHKSGAVRWVKHTTVSRKDEAGEVIAVDGLISNITVRRTAEEELRHSQALYHSLVESLPQNIFRKDLDERFTFVSQRFCALLGKPASEILGQTDFDFFPSELARKYQADDRRILQTREIFETIEENCTPDGKKHFVQVVKIPIYDAHGSPVGIQGIFWDITEKKRNEEALLQALANLRKSHEELKAAQMQLIQAEKMESVGTLAAGVAHEVKNPLQIILLGVRYLSKILPPGDENAAQVLDDIRQAIGRADNIVRGLLEFSAAQQTPMKDENLNAIVEQSLWLVNYEITRRQIVLTKELAPTLPLLRLEKIKIEQVFINLTMNAMQAMPPGGSLLVRTAVRRLADLPAHLRDQLGGESEPDAPVILAEVEDNGPGIPQAMLSKVFDPFFTTKPIGQGTGLGLTVVKKIVDLNGGQIAIHNRPEGGTRATLLFRPEWRNKS